MKKTMAPTARLTALILSLLFLLSGFVSLTPVTAADATTLTIYHTNDIHGAFAPASNTIGADDLAGLKAANPQALLLDAGDAVQGLTLVSLSQGAAAITLMNAAGYDASALGNHDFDYGLDALLANAVAADFPFLAANVLKEDQRPLLAGTTYAGGTKRAWPRSWVPIADWISSSMATATTSLPKASTASSSNKRAPAP